MKSSKKARKSTFFIVLILIAAFVFTAFFGIENYYGDKRNVIFKGANDIRWGIDIRGGVEAVFTPVIENNTTYSNEGAKKDMDAAKEIIETRLVNKNITDYEVYTDVDNMQVIVRFPWSADESDFDPTAAVKELGETALLTFCEGSSTQDKIILSAKDNDFKEAKAGYHPETGAPVVYLTFASSGRSKFAEATARAAGSTDPYISIWLDDQLIEAASVKQRIDSESCFIEGDFDYDSATNLANKINAGNLPFELSIDDSKLQVVSPTLGNEALKVMVLAGSIALALICILMIVRYRLPGVVTSISLIGQIAGIIAATSGFFGSANSFTLTIPGIAGIILSIGIGVDANVIAAERIRDEFRRGKSLDGAVNSGFKNSLSSIIDGNVTVFIVSIVLMGAFGTPDSLITKLFKPLLFMFSSSISGNIYAFGYTLLIGVVFNFIFGVLATRVMVKSLTRYKKLRNPWLYGGEKEVKEGK